MGAVIIIECHAEFGKVGQMLFASLGDQLFRSNAFPIRSEHDRRAVGVIRANVIAKIAALFLETHPNIGLNIFDQMTEMNGAVGVRQRAGDENFSI